MCMRSRLRHRCLRKHQLHYLCYLRLRLRLRLHLHRLYLCLCLCLSAFPVVSVPCLSGAVSRRSSRALQWAAEQGEQEIMLEQGVAGVAWRWRLLRQTSGLPSGPPFPLSPTGANKKSRRGEMGSSGEMALRGPEVSSRASDSLRHTRLSLLPARSHQQRSRCGRAAGPERR